MAGKRWNLGGAEIYVVLYSTKHGKDIWVRSSQKSAMEVVSDVIFNTLDEIEADQEAPEVAERLRKLLNAGKTDEAWREWAKHQGDNYNPEEIEIQKTKIDEPNSIGF